MIHFTCDHCGRRLRARDERGGARMPCPACMRSLTVPQPADPPPAVPLPVATWRPSPQPATPPAAFGACPACGSMQTQKASIAWESGTQYSKTTTAGVAFDGEGVVPVVAGSSGTSHSALALRLAPPVPMNGEISVWEVLVVLLGIVGAIYGIHLALSGTTASGIAMLLLSVVGMAWAISSAVTRSRDASAYNATTYQVRRDAWHITWICHRCGKMFLLGGDA